MSGRQGCSSGKEAVSSDFHCLSRLQSRQRLINQLRREGFAKESWQCHSQGDCQLAADTGRASSQNRVHFFHHYFNSMCAGSQMPVHLSASRAQLRSSLHQEQVALSKVHTSLHRPWELGGGLKHLVTVLPSRAPSSNRLCRMLHAMLQVAYDSQSCALSPLPAAAAAASASRSFLMLSTALRAALPPALWSNFCWRASACREHALAANPSDSTDGGNADEDALRSARPKVALHRLTASAARCRASMSAAVGGADGLGRGVAKVNG